jgi:DNA polymerase-3 subunit epsilon
VGRAVVDTIALARACGVTHAGLPGESSVEAVARQLRLPVHTPHHALGDAVTAAEIFLVLATRLERRAEATPERPLPVQRLCALSQQQKATELTHGW